MMQNYGLKLKILLFSIAAVVALAAIFFFFVPAFAGKIEIPSGITIGKLEIRLYGLILGAAILISYFFARKNAWKFGISTDEVDDYAFWGVIVGILGARIYYVVFNAGYYLENVNEIYKIWHGGISIYGGILAGLVYTYAYARKKAYSFVQLLDLVAISLPLGQAIGRFGNFFNQEAYGTLTDLPWKMYVAAEGTFHHPAFLYEALFDVIVFAILYTSVGKIKPGTAGLAYLALYSLGRFFIESIRVDSFIISGFRVDQIVAFLIFVIAGFFILRRPLQLKNP